MAAKRKTFEVLTERSIEWLIKLCGISAILFVFGIFFFVFREAVPVLGKLSIPGFLFSAEWDPASSNGAKYGILALLAGTFSVTHSG